VKKTKSSSSAGVLLRPGWLARFFVVIALALPVLHRAGALQLGKNTKTSGKIDQIARTAYCRPGAATTFLCRSQDSSAPYAQWRRSRDRALPARRRMCWPGPPRFDGDPPSRCWRRSPSTSCPVFVGRPRYVRPSQWFMGAAIRAATASRTLTIAALAARLRTDRRVRIRSGMAVRTGCIRSARASASAGNGVPLAGS